MSEMSHFFDARAKHAFAVGKLKAFKEEVQKLERATITLEHDEARGLDTVKMVIQKVPLGFQLSLGEIIHHLRGALDYLTTDIVENITKKPSHRVNFPRKKDDLIRQKRSTNLAFMPPQFMILLSRKSNHIV
jgi:hypothetical protein